MTSNNSEDICDIKAFKIYSEKQLYAQFAFIKRIGKGSFGKVYEAIKKTDGSKCSIKKVARKISHTGSMKSRFDQEIKILSSIHHPFIINFFGMAQSPNYSFLIMELCEGGSLSTHLQSIQKYGQGFAEKSVKVIVQQLTSALAYLHNRCIVHRDIKSDNVLLLCYVVLEQIKNSIPSNTSEGNLMDIISVDESDSLVLPKSSDTNLTNKYNAFHPKIDDRFNKINLTSSLMTSKQVSHTNPIHIKLIDFGFAVELKKNEESLGDFCGTPYYMAPEVLAGRSYTRMCDVWSLGIIIFQLLCNRFPFESTSDVKVINQVINCKASEISDRICSHVSNQAKEFLMCILQPDPVKRNSSAELITHPWLVNNLDKSGVENYTDKKHLYANIFNLMKSYHKPDDITKQGE